jgi:folate-binding protein YgfZ
VWFLQNTITTDVEGVEDEHWIESCFLDPKGHVLAHFRAGFLGDEVWLDTSPDGGPVLADWFVRYRFRTKVEIEPRPARCLTVVGPPAQALAEAGQIVLPGPVFGDSLGDIAVADAHDTSAPDLPQAPPELYDVLRIEAGVPAFGIDYTTKDLPQEAGLSRVLSVEKGCYVGQETIARIHFRGHINKVVRPLAFLGAEPPPGTKLVFEDKPVGVVTSSVRSPRLGPIGIGMVRVEPTEGAELEIEGGGSAVVGPIPAGTKVKAL